MILNTLFIFKFQEIKLVMIFNLGTKKGTKK